MQVAAASATSATPSQMAGVTTVRVLEGNLSGVPAGTLLTAVVTEVSQGRALVVVNGQTLTVGPAGSLQTGPITLLWAPSSSPAAGTSQTSLPVAAMATEASLLPTVLAAAILRDSTPPDLGATFNSLLAELATLRPTDLANSAAGPPVLQAADDVLAILQTFLPSPPRTLDATELQALVEDGGLHYEAKLVRIQNGPDGDEAESTDERGQSSSSNPSSTANPSARSTESTGTDLKDALLRLLVAAQEFGTSLELPAARSALSGIETLQAANVFAQAEETPYILQIPYPDGAAWRTLSLAVEPEDRRGRGSGTSGGFRMLMHVPLSTLGETWIDAALTGNNLPRRLLLGRCRPARAREGGTSCPAKRPARGRFSRHPSGCPARERIARPEAETGRGNAPGTDRIGFDSRHECVRILATRNVSIWSRGVGSGRPRHPGSRGCRRLQLCGPPSEHLL